MFDASRLRMAVAETMREMGVLITVFAPLDFLLSDRSVSGKCCGLNHDRRSINDGWRYIRSRTRMTPATETYLLRWSIPLAVGYGLWVWLGVLHWLERRREKSSWPNSRGH
jgi:hypothetical protein